MPRHDEEHGSRRRRSLSRLSASDSGARMTKDQHSGRKHRDDHQPARERHRRDRSASVSEPDRHSRHRKYHRIHGRRSRSRSPREQLSRRHRHSRERRRDDRDSRESPQPRRQRHADSPSRGSPGAERRSKKPLLSQKDAFSKTSSEISHASTPASDKERPNFATTGRLAAETNTVQTGDGAIVLKYHEPPEARKPAAKDAWRLYIFKGDELLETVELGGRSCWLIGRERFIADLPIDHPSCSKQHAALQFRYVEKRNEYGDKDGRVRPYLVDLESANGSTVNGDPLPPGRYMELIDKDVLKFGLSTREYVLMLPPAD
ncbi:hypothetical protein LOZ53_000701 [Ophidiomyces ophidiicola]|uniref:uncharacterized protein n=1 Tax=Ophidiomyces ophidiicola TaxID=1387563 RepID=UPI0020C25B6F|nr:uncharacterized protein LOZ57_003057 [Ophidiomyces ophidiicola]KAI1947905.1 hypothetical protein LOZ57_003057 [Ophidiomyces ophidiicola]KAI1997341.1 hypothetical protein LOZ53_000701 [Ophidiomyces ophidiicola]KAI2060578.1 hypothetical protein LOZ43_001716 [Ophidiomyces ophidiicola]